MKKPPPSKAVPFRTTLRVRSMVPPELAKMLPPSVAVPFVTTLRVRLSVPPGLTKMLPPAVPGTLPLRTVRSLSARFPGPSISKMRNRAAVVGSRWMVASRPLTVSFLVITGKALLALSGVV